MKQNFTIRLIVLIFLVSTAHQYYSCKKVDVQRIVLLSTGEAQDISDQSAYLTGEVIDAGEEGSVSEYGFVYSTVGVPTVTDNKVIRGTGTPPVGSLGVLLEEIDSDTDFYFRAYAIEKDGKITYGNTSYFRTLIDPDATVPVLETLQIFDVGAYSVRVTGVLTDDGGATLLRKGFCIGTETQPNIEDDISSQNGSELGDYENTFVNLTPNTEYFVRAYAENSLGVGYGEDLTFTSDTAGGVVNEWLFYDDGANDDGIGLNSGGGFDVAIRFAPEQLSEFDGFKLTKIKFFPKVGLPVEYYLEIFTGSSPSLDDMVYEQFVENPETDVWNEVLLDEPYVIDASVELWVGYFINNQQSGVYPAGIDDGPGENGHGDMISVDGLVTWGTLADAEIDANWNIQVFVTNADGEEVSMKRTLMPQTSRKPNTNVLSKSISSEKAVK